MKYMETQAFLEVKLAFLLYYISLFQFANAAGGKLFFSWLN